MFGLTLAEAEGKVERTLAERSDDRPHHAAVDAKRRPVGRRGLLGGDIDHHVGHLLNGGEPLQQRGGPMLLDEFGAIWSTDTPSWAAMASRKASTPSERVGPGSTALTVTPVPAVSSARPRDTASWAVLVTP